MKISDEISLSARNLLRRKGRTALTLVGVVIGTCMVVLMISLGIAQTKTNEEMLQSWGDLTQVQIYGYGTMVGERGVTLSGGQKQRVAIARTLTQKTPVIVFDDSLSAVDTETDESIRRNLSERVQGVTQILVSHRILTLLGCDRVLVLEHGRVKQLGTPEELLQQDGLFREIYQAQMAIGEEEPA